MSVVTRLRSLASLFVLAMLVASCGGAGTSSSSSGGDLVIAAFSPFTGTDPGYGPEQAAGCWAAVRSINDAGGVLGHKMTCVNSDSKGDPADAIPAVQQLSGHHPKSCGHGRTELG